MKFRFLTSFCSIALALLYSSTALAADATPDVSILSTVTQAMAISATNNIGPMALGWLGALMTLQFVVTNISLLKNGGEISDVFYKLIGFLFAGGISVILLKQGPDFIDSVGNGVFAKFLTNVPSAGAIITATLGICTTLIAAIFAIGVVHTPIAMLLVNVVLIVFGIGMYMAVKVFMLYLELGMVVLLSPLSFSFLGLTALRDQGIAPFKSLISLIYRAVVLGVIYSALGGVITVAGNNLSGINWINPVAWPAAVNTIFAMLCSYPVIGYLAYKSDAMASALASGATNMSAGDVASAAAVGAAAGAAAASAGSAASNTGASAVQSMSDYMKDLGSGGGISDASSRGTGQTPDDAPKRSTHMSTADSAAAKADSLGRASKQSDFEAGGILAQPASTGAGSPGAAPSASGSAEATGGKAESAGSESQAGGNAQSTTSTGDDRTQQQAAGGAPVRPGESDRAAPRNAPVRPEPGSTGSSAGIGGNGNQNQPAREPSLGDRLKDFGRHIEQDKTATHVSINTHRTD